MSQKLSVSAVSKEDAILKTLVTDLSGGLREIIFPISYLPEVISTGIAYDGSSFEGVNDINSSDSIIKGVEETLVKVDPIIADTEKNEYWIICEILDTEGKPHPNCSRSKLVELQKKLSKEWKGGNMFVGAEPEAFFVEKKEDIGLDIGGNANYFNPKDVKLRQFVKKEDFQFKKEALQLLKYKEDQQDDRSFNKVDKFMKNTKRSQLNNAIVIIAADRIDCYSFLPKLRKISPVIKDNIKSLLKVKTLNDINKFMQNRSFVEILYSKKKMNIFISYIEKYNSYYFLKNLELLFFYEMDVFKILQINQHYLKEGVRHHSAFRKIIEYVKFKKKTEDIEFYLKRLFSLSKSNDLDFIGYIETGELPVAFLEKTEEEVDEYKKKLLKDASMSIETVDDDFFIFKRYRIRHIHSIFQLKAVGQEMHHCVGGYTKHLIQRTMVFFDIYDEKNVRYTLAAKWERVEDEKVLSVFDFKRKYNEIPGEDRFADIYDFLVEMKDKISIVLPQKRTNENPFNT